MVFASPVSLHLSASSMATRMAWLLSGAGRMPSTRANCSAASKTAVCSTARASISPSWYSWLRTVDMPWKRRPPAWLGEGMKPLPSVYILARGQIMPVSQKSYANTPRVKLGQEAGSTAMI